MEITDLYYKSDFSLKMMPSLMKLYIGDIMGPVHDPLASCCMWPYIGY